MSRLVTLLESTRLYMLVLTLPGALLWMGVESSGGVLMVIAHSLLVLFYCLTLDRKRLAAGADRLFTLNPDKGAVWFELVDRAHGLVGVVLGVVSIVLLVAELWAGVVALAAAVLIVLMVGTPGRGSLRWRLRLAEFLWPGAALLGPALLIRAYAIGRKEQAGPEAQVALMSDATLGATVLGSIVLGVYILLTLMRDEGRHRGEGLRTTATSLGYAGATATLVAWLLVLGALAPGGVAEGWWSWEVAAVGVWMAIIAALTVALRRAALGVGLWLLGAVVLGVMLVTGA